MRYWYVEGTHRDAHVIAAETEPEAREIAKRAGMNVTMICELKADTYQAGGIIL